MLKTVGAILAAAEAAIWTGVILFAQPPLVVLALLPCGAVLGYRRYPVASAIAALIPALLALALLVPTLTNAGPYDDPIQLLPVDLLLTVPGIAAAALISTGKRAQNART